MTRRRLLLALGVVLAVLVALIALPGLIPPRPGVTAANCARISPGMRQAEVEAILGGQVVYAFDRHGLPGIRPDDGEERPRPDYPTAGVWLGDEGMVLVRFDADGAVISVKFAESRQSTFWERLRLRVP